MVAAVEAQPKLLIDSREAARLLSISESTLLRLARNEGLPYVRLLRSIRYSPADVASWVEARKSNSGSQLLAGGISPTMAA